MPSEIWYETTDPFANVNGCAFEVWEWVSNYIQYFIINVIAYTGCHVSQTTLVKGSSEEAG